MQYLFSRLGGSCFAFAMLRSWLVMSGCVLFCDRSVAQSVNAHALFESARTAFQTGGDASAALPMLAQSAELGHAEAQSMLALAHAQGLAGLPSDAASAIRWFRKAAEQGHAHASFNLVQLCDAQPQCLGGSLSERIRWLGLAAAENVTEASFQLGNALLTRAHETDPTRALAAFLSAAASGHAAATFNAAHQLALGGVGVRVELTRAVFLFERVARGGASTTPKVAADARAALAQLRRRWVITADDDDDDESAAARWQSACDAGAAGEALDAEVRTREVRCAQAWVEATREWRTFQQVFHGHPSYENMEAIRHLSKTEKTSTKRT